MKKHTILFISSIAIVGLSGCNSTKPHEHTFSGEWSKNSVSHWRVATCEHTDLTKDFGVHIDSDNNGKCDICDYIVHVHTFDNTKWESDDEKHWHPATCEHKDLRGNEASHIDEDEDYYCDVCNCILENDPDIREYYKDYDLTLSGKDLQLELQKLCFDTHSNYVLYSSYASYASFTNDHISSEAAPSTVAKDEKGNYIVNPSFSGQKNEYFYTGKIATGIGAREHVWSCASSSGLWVHDEGGGNHYVDGKNYAGGGSDLYHVRPTTSSVNTARGNAMFVDFDDEDFDGVRSEVVEVGDAGTHKLKLAGGSKSGSDSYMYASKAEPADEYKGDIARILVYLWIHYGYRGNYFGHQDYIGSLSLQNVMGYSSLEKIHDVLCEWNELDPPNETEKLRNNTVQGIQGNRNPFVDYPKLMNHLFE